MIGGLLEILAAITFVFILAWGIQRALVDAVKDAIREVREEDNKEPTK